MIIPHASQSVVPRSGRFRAWSHAVSATHASPPIDTPRQTGGPLVRSVTATLSLLEKRRDTERDVNTRVIVLSVIFSVLFIALIGFFCWFYRKSIYLHVHSRRPIDRRRLDWRYAFRRGAIHDRHHHHRHRHHPSRGRTRTRYRHTTHTREMHEAASAGIPPPPPPVVVK